MPVAVVTGSGGLIGAESVRHFAQRGWEVIGIDNDMRSRLFGAQASTRPNSQRLAAQIDGFRWLELDIRDQAAVDRAFARRRGQISLIVHAAAQPSHDWAASDPHADFTINALGTLNLLQATRRHAPDATFAFLSTNKVYGDRPNTLPLCEQELRLDLPLDHPRYDGIGSDMAIDQTMHSLFGVSKAAADLLVQEYGRYFGLPTVCLRCGCMAGPDHAGAQAHGFLSYLMRCTVSGTPYTVLGYDGKQVRDTIHPADVVSAIEAFLAAPRPGAVYNLGGGRDASVSLREAIPRCERISGRRLDVTFSEHARLGDHRWWITDLSEFRRDHPGWRLTRGVDDVLGEIYESNVEHWSAPARST